MGGFKAQVADYAKVLTEFEIVKYMLEGKYI